MQKDKEKKTKKDLTEAELKTLQFLSAQTLTDFSVTFNNEGIPFKLIDNDNIEPAILKRNAVNIIKSLCDYGYVIMPVNEEDIVGK